MIKKCAMTVAAGLLTAMLTPMLWSPAIAGSGTGEKPNVVLIMADDHALDAWGCFGGENYTPTIDKLAADGVRFERAYCVSAACTPSRFNLLTGKYSGRSNHPWAAGNKQQPYCVQWVTFLSEGDPTIATRLNDAGYYTGMAGKWHVTQHVDKTLLPEIDRNADLDDPETSRKLAEYQKVVVDDIKRIAGFDFAANVLANNADYLPVKALEAHHTEWITKGALEFLDSTTEEEPFFLYLAPTSVHSPMHHKTLDKDPVYTPEGKIAPEDLSASPSRDSVRVRLVEKGLPVNHETVGLLMMDDTITAVTRKLDEMGAADDTLVILVADHGKEPGKLACYESGARTPMVVKWPGRLEPNTTTDALASMVDVTASILEVAGAAPTGDDPIDGLSFLKRDGDGVSRKRKYLYFENGYTRAVSDGNFKFITLRYPDKVLEEMRDSQREVAADHADMPRQEQPVITMKSYPHYFDPDQLYYLPEDPFEQKNLVGDPAYSADYTRMKGELRNVLVTFENPYPLDEKEFLESAEFQALAKARLKYEETTKAGTDQRISEFRKKVELFQAEAAEK